MGNTGAGSRWDACLIATVNQLGTVLEEHEPDCLTESNLKALCCVLACRRTCSIWLTAMLARPATSGTKGKVYLVTVSAPISPPIPPPMFCT